MRLWRTPRTRALLIVGTLGALAGLLWLGAGVYTDLLWFHEIGQDQVYWTTLGWKLLPPAVAGLGTACFVLANLALVERWTREAPGPARPALAKVWRYRRLLQPVVAAGCGLIAIQALPDDAWRLLLLWANRSDFGTEDPVFHRDAGFFVFSLPLHALVVGWLLATIVMAGGAAGAAYALAGAPRAARAHALGLAALLLLVAAWRVRLDRLQLVLPHHDGVLTGASYSEVAVRLPALGVFVALRVHGRTPANAGFRVFRVLIGSRSPCGRHRGRVTGASAGARRRRGRGRDGCGCSAHARVHFRLGGGGGAAG